MTTLFNRIKQDQVTARKAHNALAASLLTTLIGETSIIGKNDGNRETTDSEVVAVIKKFVKGMDETLSYLAVSDQEASALVLAEKSLLIPYLPTQMDEGELREVIESIVDEVGQNMGKIMAELKSRYAGLYDGKLASTLVKSTIE